MVGPTVMLAPPPRPLCLHSRRNRTRPQPLRLLQLTVLTCWFRCHHLRLLTSTLWYLPPICMHACLLAAVHLCA